MNKIELFNWLKKKYIRINHDDIGRYAQGQLDLIEEILALENDVAIEPSKPFLTLVRDEV